MLCGCTHVDPDGDGGARVGPQVRLIHAHGPTAVRQAREAGGAEAAGSSGALGRCIARERAKGCGLLERVRRDLTDVAGFGRGEVKPATLIHFIEPTSWPCGHPSSICQSQHIIT